MHYATGVALHDAGVVSCADITMEAALTKLGHLLGQGLSPRQARKEMTIGIRGEMTIQSGAPRFALDDR
jgi:L-asparaginase